MNIINILFCFLPVPQQRGAAAAAAGVWRCGLLRHRKCKSTADWRSNMGIIRRELESTTIALSIGFLRSFTDEHCMLFLFVFFVFLQTVLQDEMANFVTRRYFIVVSTLMTWTNFRLSDIVNPQKSLNLKNYNII